MVFLVVGTLIFFYLGYKKKQNDSVWHVLPEELHFNEPPEIIGQGAFGVVVLGQYRGTKVAVKRVLPPKIMGGGSRGSLTLTASERQTLTNSVEINNNNVELGADSTTTKKEKNAGLAFLSTAKKPQISSPGMPYPRVALEAMMRAPALVVPIGIGNDCFRCVILTMMCSRFWNRRQARIMEAAKF